MIFVGYYLLYLFYYIKEGEYFLDFIGLRVCIEYWIMGFYFVCIKYLMVVFDVLEVWYKYLCIELNFV